MSAQVAQEVTMITRRQFLRRAAMGAGLVAVLSTTHMNPVPGAAHGNSRDGASDLSSSALPRNEVLSFHLDQPYIDTSGTATPYLPPPGARSAQPLANLSEEALRTHFLYL